VKVRHLNCGTLFPLGCGEMVCHVLLVETANGLVLIDSGFGSKDCGDPGRRVGPSRYLIRPVLNSAEAAGNQIEQLGFRREDVRHIVITHFDGDHIGGISDFPEAQIHVTAAKWFGATRSPSRAESSRYRSALWEHGPKLASTPLTVRSGGDSAPPRSSTRCRRASC
jgi:glyoxylase-like metal-dependent hydrolase (beta-lactamase superfamily II)